MGQLIAALMFVAHAIHFAVWFDRRMEKRDQQRVKALFAGAGNAPSNSLTA